ncbi:Protein LHCP TRANSLOCATION DEFECT [Tetrabaena socialis]|uniref:Protein LHCP TRANSLOCATION DEFECT n=1 Tax=Tetrabaena socialis TaxID=47790 RepID=A0A2J8A141_9CHLO|nr:Protein LHCP TRANSLOCATION DEFECT [Tetrabaena socialis]|eukprot:PNH06239.1 Protein LHCP TRANSLOCATION DEFECT [Tetrabaena socialis]
MRGLVLAQSAPCTVCRPSRAARRCAPRPFTSSKLAPEAPRYVGAQAWFKFGKNGQNAEDAGIVGSQGRDEYNYDDVEAYFNYMGFLATEGTYDRMEAMLATKMHHIDIILLLACSENDTPKVQEILKAGADPTVRGLDGKTPLELAAKPELRAMLEKALASKGVAV